MSTPGLPPAPLPDALRPTARQAQDAWSARVRADRAQVERCREIDDAADFYAPVAQRFAHDPRRSGDTTLEALLAIARLADTWLDIGSGGGRYALPLALRTQRVIAVEPSPAMRAVLRSAMTDHAIGNVDVIAARWPLPEGSIPRSDVALMAHVGYDIEDISAFLAAAEASAARGCVAVMSEGAMTTAASCFWRPVHGEDRVPLPALPELLTLLLARGRLPSVTLAERPPSSFETLEELTETARRQLWVRPGSDRDRRLQQLVATQAMQRDGAWALDWRSTRVGIVSWGPGLQPTLAPGSAG